MPEQSHPPYAATAQVQPRQLNRWLDVNAQNGPLRRTSKFITLDAFSEAVTWLGYSDIVLLYNFVAGRNFSFKLNYEAPVSPNYTLCVAWVDTNGDVYRYSLWRATGDVIYFELPEYTGQLIKGNFRLEVWSTNSTPAVQTTDITIYTSVLGDQDYRYGVDSALATGTSCTSFANINTALATAPAQIDILFWWDYNQGLTVASQATSWVDVIGAVDLTPIGGGMWPLAFLGFNSLTTVQDAYGMTTVANSSTVVRHSFVTIANLFSATGDCFQAGYLRIDQNGTQFDVSLGDPSITTKTTTNLVAGKWYTFESYYNAAETLLTVNVWDCAGSYIAETLTFTTSGTMFSMQIVYLGYRSVVGAATGISQFVGYENPLSEADRNTTLEWLFSQTSNYDLTLPLTFPACSQPVTN